MSRGLKVLGVMKENPGTCEVLLENNKMYKIEESKWKPHEEDFRNGKITVHADMAGNKIMAISAVEKENIEL